MLIGFDLVVYENLILQRIFYIITSRLKIYNSNAFIESNVEV